MLEFGNKNEFSMKIDLRIIEFYFFFPRKIIMNQVHF